MAGHEPAGERTIVDDMVRAALRGWDLLLTAWMPLLLGGLVWTGLNLVSAGLLTGPALVGLFTVAFAAHQGRAAEPGELFAAFRRPAAPLLAGLVFVLPFQLADFLGSLSRAAAEAAGREAGVPGLPLMAGLGLAAWFALAVHVFAVLADRPEAKLREAVSEAWTLAESATDAGRWTGLARHLAYGLGVFLVVAALRALPHVGGLTLVVTLPAAACLLVAWHAHLRAPSRAAEAPAPPAPEAGESEKPAARPKRRKTPSRRSAPPADGDES